MFNKLINKLSEPVGVAFTSIKETFARCNSEEEVILLKKVIKAEFGKDKIEDLSIEAYNSICSRLEAKVK